MAEKIKISKTEILKMIKEEYGRKKTEISLKKRLNEVNTKIAGLLKECGIKQEGNLEEVEAGGEKKVKSTAWTGDKNGDVKYDEKFQIKGTHKLEEDEDFEIDTADFEEKPSDGMENDEEMTSDEVPAEGKDEEIVDILKKLADAIQERGADAVAADIAVDTDEIPASTDEIPASTDEIPAGEEEALDENAEEPQDGHSPATEKSKDGPSDKTPFTEKQTVIKEEAKKEKPILSEETKRMQILSGIRKPEEL